jgi:predicted phage replisome organizer
MSDTKKWYYLKIKDNFFDRQEIKILENQENGYIYSNLYLKLCLISLKGEGRLLFRDEIPYDEKMISVITGVPLDNVRTGLVILEKLSLIKRIESGEIWMNDIHTMIGHDNTEAQRLREYRLKIKGNDKLLECTNVQKRTKIEHQRLEIKDKSIEYRDNIDKHKKFVIPTINEIETYIKEKQYNINPTMFFAHYESNGWMCGRNKMTSWRAAITKWYYSDFNKQKKPENIIMKNPKKDNQLWETSNAE